MTDLPGADRGSPRIPGFVFDSGIGWHEDLDRYS